MDRLTASQVALEEIDLLPEDVRDFVFDRGGCDFATGAKCRLCGRWSSMPAIHHIVVRSHGALHVPSNSIVLGQGLDGHDCHLTHAQGPQSKMWREISRGSSAVDR